MANEPQTPWWSNLLAILLTFAVTLVGTIYAMSGRGVPGQGGSGGLGAFFKDTLVYMPHALILYGVIADMLTNEGVYSIGSLVGILSIFVHFLFKFIWKGTFEVIDKVIEAVTKKSGPTAPSAPAAPSPPSGAAPRPTTGPRPGSVAAGTGLRGGADAGSFFSTYTGCDIQGFDWAHSPYAPQSLVVIATIFAYYAFDLVKNRGMQNAAVTIGLGSVFFIIQTVLAGDCTLPTDPKPATNKWIQAILAAAEGLFTGGLSYSVVQMYFPNRLPSSTISPFPRMTPNMLKDGKYDADGNPWVCVGGVCYPDMSTAEARKAFAGIAAESTGNGRAAVGEDCPA